MKRQILFVILIVVMASNYVYAKRNTDIKIELGSPLLGDTITANEQFLISARIYNLGPDTITVGDSILFGLMFDGDTITFGDASGNYVPYMLLTGKELLPNDYGDASLRFTIGDGWKTGPIEFCVTAFAANATDTVQDIILTNNKSCALVYSKEDPDATCVKTVSPESPSTVLIYPNPATTEVNFDLDVKGNGKTILEVFNNAGKVILQEDKGSLQRGKHRLKLNTSSLPSGLYIYKLTVGEEVLTSKLFIN